MSIAKSSLALTTLSVLLFSIPVAGQNLQVSASEGEIDARALVSPPDVDSFYFTPLQSEAAGVFAQGAIDWGVESGCGIANTAAFGFGQQFFSGDRILLDGGGTALATPCPNFCCNPHSAGSAFFSAVFTVPSGIEAGVTGIASYICLPWWPGGGSICTGSSHASLSYSSGGVIASAQDYYNQTQGESSFTTVVGPGSYSAAISAVAPSTISPDVDAGATIWVYAKRATEPLTEGAGSHAAAFGGAIEPGGVEITVNVSVDGEFNVDRSLIAPNDVPHQLDAMGLAPLSFAVPTRVFYLWNLSVTAQISNSAVLVFGYDKDELVDGVSESALGIYHFDGDTWVPLDRYVDPVNQTVAVARTGFSTFALGVSSCHAPADFDTDCDVDANDFRALVGCMAGPGVPYDKNDLPAQCPVLLGGTGFLLADQDEDQDVDLADFGTFQNRFRGD